MYETKHQQNININRSLLAAETTKLHEILLHNNPKYAMLFLNILGDKSYYNNSS